MGLPFAIGNLTLFFAFAYLLVLRWQTAILQAASESSGDEPSDRR
jgi:hypothetical protein